MKALCTSCRDVETFVLLHGHYISVYAMYTCKFELHIQYIPMISFTRETASITLPVQAWLPSVYSFNLVMSGFSHDCIQLWSVED